MSAYIEYQYDNDCENYAHHYILPDLLKLLEGQIKSNILDLGCGNGSLARKITESGFENVYGTDASEQGIAIAKKSHKNRFFVQDLSSKVLPQELQNIFFKTIISVEVIEHLYNPDEFIIFCKDILMKNGGGELILSTPYHGYLKNLLLSIFDKWDFHHTVDWQGGHIKFWSKKTLSEILKKHGFIVEKFKGCGRFPLLWKSMIIKAKIS